MKILVTGASGNVGECVVKELLRKNEKVVAAGRNISKLNNIFGEKVDPVAFDFTDKSTFENALKDVDKVFLMRPPYLGNPKDLYPFIDELKKKSIKHISFLSLMGIEKNPIPPHYKIEKYIESSGISYAHIRPGFFMQNISTVHSVEIREMNKIFVPAGKSKTSFIDVKDIGLAIATILNNSDQYENTTHTITGPEALSYYDVAEVLTKVTERKIIYSNPGIFKYRKHMIKERGLDKKYVNVTVALYIMTRMGTAKEVTDDFFKLTNKKARNFETFIKDNLDVFMPEG